MVPPPRYSVALQTAAWIWIEMRAISARKFNRCRKFITTPTVNPVWAIPTVLWALALCVLITNFPGEATPLAARIWIGIGIALIAIVNAILCMLIAYSGTARKKEYHYVDVHHVMLASPLEDDLF